MNIKNQVVSGAEKLSLYWKRPPKGKYMSYKEIASLSVGGMGVKFILTIIQVMILYTGNVIIGNTIGIAPRPLYVIYVMSVIASIPLTALRARIIDNSRNKKGKYRPYILYMGIPTVILGIGFTFMPYSGMTMLGKCVTVLLFNIGFQFFYLFMNDSYESIVNVLSPNTYERSDVYSIKSITDSFAPTLINLLLPLVAKAVTGKETIYDMQVYKVFYPPLLVIGLLMSILIYTNTQEKIVQAKSHTVQIKFTDALRAVARNKYFWIISLASCIGFLESAFANILGWMYNYQEVCSSGQFALITTIYGNSSLWAMVFAPVLIRKFGKRKILIGANLMNIAFIATMYPVVEDASRNSMIWMFLFCLFINGIVNQLTITLTPSINGDIRDYQQYTTGERMDGVFAVVGIIGSVFSLLTGSILPEIYDKAGLNSDVARSLGFSGENVYDVLYDERYFRSICGVLVLASAIGATLNVIPYFFYDLTEIKQRSMVAVLKIRAMFEDYGNNRLSDTDLVETIDIIDEAKEYFNQEPVELSKDRIKSAKKSGDKSALKQAKLEYKQDKNRNDSIFISKYVMREITKFSTLQMQKEIERAEKIVAAGLAGLPTLSTVSLAQARALPKNTEEEKEYRINVIDEAHEEIYSKKTIKRYYPDGVEEFDNSVFDKLFAAEDKTNEELKKAYSDLTQARKDKNSAEVKQLKSTIEHLRLRKNQISHEIKKATNQDSIYNRAAKPYIKAVKLLQQKKDYARFEEIKAEYENSSKRNEEERIRRDAEAAKEKAEKEAEIARIKAEKKAAKTAKK